MCDRQQCFPVHCHAKKIFKLLSLTKPQVIAFKRSQNQQIYKTKTNLLLDRLVSKDVPRRVYNTDNSFYIYIKKNKKTKKRQKNKTTKFILISKWNVVHNQQA